MPDAPIPYACPRCRGALAAATDAYHCAACAISYPIIFGIPDFRLRPDPYISLEDDRAKGLRIAREAAGRDLRGLLEFYWSITSDVEPTRARIFIESVLAARSRADDILDWLAQIGGAGTTGEDARATPDSPILEIGCGAGGLLHAALARGAQAVGVDRGFRWLVVAKLALEREGLAPQLACADARELPFADASFSLALADGVIEHNDSEQNLIPAEAARILRPGGRFFASTPNRYAPLPDPHYRVPFLGYLPRAAMPAAVRLWRRKDYRHIRLLGPLDLAALLRNAGLADVKISPAAFGPQTRERLSPPARAAFDLYSLILAIPPARLLLTPISPVLWSFSSRPA